jgi:hypothetical protein
MIIKSMSQTKSKARQEKGLRTEYRFDYTKAKANRFTPDTQPGSLAVLLDPDVARVFKSAESVNTVLRALVRAMPRDRTPATVRKGATISR